MDSRGGAGGSSSERVRTLCPRCGADNRCAFGADQACWCATGFAPAFALPKSPESCYCRRCLSELLQQRQRDGGSA